MVQVTVKRKPVQPVRLAPKPAPIAPNAGASVDSIVAAPDSTTRPRPSWIDSQIKQPDHNGGHHPQQTDTIDGWTFKRCKCGFSLVMTPAGLRLVVESSGYGEAHHRLAGFVLCAIAQLLAGEDQEMTIEPVEQHWPAARARPIADELVEALTPFCERVCIAGSLRRGKAEVGDIEILYVPRFGQVRSQGELFVKSASLADELLYRWLDMGVLAQRKNKKGVATWGSLNKLAMHIASGISVDLFATTLERWFVSFVIRHGLGRDEYGAVQQRTYSQP
jgi:hypothetical protein